MSDETRHRIDAMLGINAPKTNAPVMRSIADAASIETVKQRGARPDGVGDGVNDCAPARGPAMLYRPEEVSRTEEGNFRFRRMTSSGAHALRMGDAFDVMQEQADRGARRKDKNARADPIFSAAQISTARGFATLYQRIEKGAIKCSSLEAIGGGQGGDFMDAYTRDRERMRHILKRVGNAWAVSPRRAAPQGDRRRAIRVFDVLMLVTVREHTLNDVLARYGWARSTKYRGFLRAELKRVLDDIYGL